jgi:hypothetical protein
MNSESGTLAEGCTITFSPTPEGGITNTSKEVITFRGGVIASTRFGRFSPQEISEHVLSVRLFLAAEAVMASQGIDMPSSLETKRHHIRGIGELCISLGNKTFVPAPKFSNPRYSDDEDVVYYASSKGHVHTKVYDLPDIWITDRFGKWQRMDSAQALSKMTDFLNLNKEP